MKKTNLMKGLIIFSFCFAFTLMNESCTKNVVTKQTTTPVTVNDINGLWVGTYTDDGAPQQGSQFFSFAIYPDQTLIVESRPQNTQLFASGTWTLIKDTLRCNYTYFSSIQGGTVYQTAMAVYDSTNSKLSSGIWSDVYGTGKFTMNKVY